MNQMFQTLATELNVNVAQIKGAVTLMDEGATVPFIARYRKEVTGAMDDGQLRQLSERLTYLREMNERRDSILGSIEEQGKLDAVLKAKIMQAETKTQLEDLYLPYKPKRRTKGQMAIEAGLEPLADALYNDPSQIPEQLAVSYINADEGYDDETKVLEGARYILMERFAEDAEILALCRETLRQKASFIVTVADKKVEDADKFQDYFDYQEQFTKIPSHRMLAILRGRSAGVLRFSLDIPSEDEIRTHHPCEGIIARHANIKHQNCPADDWLAKVVQWTWKVKLHHSIESELVSEKREEAEMQAIQVFADNLKDLLLAAPAGARTTLGLDPGFRTGVKVVVVAASGKILEHTAIFPHPPQKQWDQSLAILAALCKKHAVELIAIGNGTASRETDKLAAELLSKFSELKAQKLMISEAGASVYSASELAAKEFPDFDVTVRGAISIARRLQDPLAELVKIDPKAIGVGQYQHDVNQLKLSKSLDAVVEDCVNAVGVELNTASSALLARVSGISSSLAENIVAYREQNNGFNNRKELMNVPRLGDKVFEQAAGFLRIRRAANDGTNPLDASCVHPESYEIVEQMAKDHNRSVSSLIGDAAFLKMIKPANYVSDTVGEITIKDILSELEKPGRDPRPEFVTATFKEGVEKLSDLALDMILEGVVTNVTNFGAFVDVGVHQDGLVHISALSDRFVKDPRDVVKAGDIVKVKVMEVDVARKRIALSMRLTDDSRDQVDNTNKSAKGSGARRSHQNSSRPNSSSRPSGGSGGSSTASGAMADALAAAFKKK